MLICCVAQGEGAFHGDATSTGRMKPSIVSSADLKPHLSASLVIVLPVAIQVVVVVEEIRVCCVPEGQRLNDFRVLQRVTLVILHLSSSTMTLAS